MYNRFPTPYGLVREGVAPDHQSIKAVTRVFDRIGADERFRFLGNVTVGEDVPVEDLRRLLPHDRLRRRRAVRPEAGDPRRGPPGQRPGDDLRRLVQRPPGLLRPGVRSLARARGRDRERERGVDVARILARVPDELAVTDIADHALDALRESDVREILMLGRRGPAQAKFTSAELKEFGEMTDVDVRVDPAQLELDEESRALVEAERRVRRNVEILEEFAARRDRGRARGRSSLRFFTSPVEILGTDRVEAVRVERNHLEPGPDGRMRAVGSGETEVIECGLVLRSIGYRGVPLPGVPFDERRGVIPNEAGRVTETPGGPVRPREYAVGLDQARAQRDHRHEQARRRRDRAVDDRRRAGARGARRRPRSRRPAAVLRRSAASGW